MRSMERSYMTSYYAFHRNFGHNMHYFRDISPNRSQRSKFDLSDHAKMTFILIQQSTYFVTVLISSHQSYTTQNINISYNMHCLWDRTHRKLNDCDSIFEGHLKSKVIRWTERSYWQMYYTCIFHINIARSHWKLNDLDLTFKCHLRSNVVW